MSDVLNHTMCDILEIVARFKFVCLSQMLPLLGKSTSYVREQLSRLKGIGLLASYNLEKPIKSESMYYLTEKGKAVLLDNAKVFAEDIKLPIGAPLAVRDYPHRRSTVSVLIGTYYHLSALNLHIAGFSYYFDKIGNNRKAGTLESVTKISIGDRHFIPDAIMLTGDAENRNIILIECFCDATATRPLAQIFGNYLPAIAIGSPGLKYGLKKNPIVLSAFEHGSIKDKVVAKLRQDSDFMPFAELFYFTSIEDMLHAPATAWKDIHGNIVNFNKQD